MYVKSLSLRGIRNYRKLDLELGPGINLFFGDNAKGKTNLVEAVCYLASLRSFRGAKTAELLCWGEGTGRLAGRVGPRNAPVSGRAAYTSLSVGLENGKRRVAVDGKRPQGAAGYLRVLKVSSFSPEDLFLVREYPSHRRRFLDRSIFHLRPGYLELANRYRRALTQLNAALKAGDLKVVTAWEDVLAPMAAEVSVMRAGQVELVRGRAAELFGKVLGGDELGVAYKTAVDVPDQKSAEDAYRERLEAKRPEAMRRGHCTVGPHTDDLVMTLSGRDIKSSGSRGQGRLALLALVLADAELYKEETGSYPVLLLDDVGSELDGKRRRALMEHISRMGQALMTATSREIMDGVDGRAFTVDGGRVVPA